MATPTPTKVSSPRRSALSSIVAIVIAAAGLMFAVLGLAVVIRDDDGGPAGIKSAEDAAASGNPIIELGEMYIEGDLAVDEGATVTVVNEGAAPHNLTVDRGPATPVLNAEQATDLDLAALAPDAYTVFCSIEGHRAAGMEAEVVIGPGG